MSRAEPALRAAVTSGFRSPITAINDAEHHFAESLERATQIKIHGLAFADRDLLITASRWFISTSVLRSSKLLLEVSSVSTMRCTSDQELHLCFTQQPAAPS